MFSLNLIDFMFALCLAIIVSPLCIFAVGKFKAKQTILHYVKEHEGKNGTPTMGGFIFIVSFLCAFFVFLQGEFLLCVICVLTTLAYGLLGFLDDFIKIKYKQNLGLKAYQKIIGQLAISFVVAYFCYASNLVGSEMIIPFTTKTFDIGVFIVPFLMFVFVAVVNSVNLIDGLDGLASSVSFVVVLGFVGLLFFYSNFNNFAFMEYQNLQRLGFCMAGALLGYYATNCFPAKIFMGDTGSLALGGFITVFAAVSKLTLYLPIIGIMFVVTAISDVLQVAYYKKTKKRIFKMAPLHHHFQMKGHHENKIVVYYNIVTLVCVLVCFAVVYGG